VRLDLTRLIIANGFSFVESNPNNKILCRRRNYES
jgi:hypothetical protein